MKKIHLTKSKFALVDDEDYEFLMQWKWYAMQRPNTYYAVRSFGKQGTILMHREILGLKAGDGKHTDHINHNGLDNRKKKLRVCTTQQNGFNRRKNTKGSSLYKGVYQIQPGRKWLSQIRHNGKDIYLGCHTTQEDAALAYNKKAKELFGKFANLNIVKP